MKYVIIIALVFHWHLVNTKKDGAEALAALESNKKEPTDPKIDHTDEL